LTANSAPVNKILLEQPSLEPKVEVIMAKNAVITKKRKVVVFLELR